MFFALVGMALVVTHAASGAGETQVAPDDVRALRTAERYFSRLEAWGDGVAFRSLKQPWAISNFPTLNSEVLEGPSGEEVVDLFQRGKEQYLCVRANDRISVLHRKDGPWESLRAPDEVTGAKNPMIIPSDVGIVLASGSKLWWERDGVWKQFSITPCPTVLSEHHARMLQDDPLNPSLWGETRFVRHGHLYVSSAGGEFGSIISRRNLELTNGPWKILWRDMHAERMFQDDQGVMWMFLHLAHLTSYNYKLERTRGRTVAWEKALGASVNRFERPQFKHPQLRYELGADALVCDVTLTTSGQPALLVEDEGVFLLGNDKHPCLLHFDFWRVPCANPTRRTENGLLDSMPHRLCFDAHGHVYVATQLLGILVFHRDGAGPWRVRQVLIEE
jgi:hypothetical protein